MSIIRLTNGKEELRLITHSRKINLNAVGLRGLGGPEGLSAYEVAVNNGFLGTEQEWLNSLVGASHTHDVTQINATGTPDETTYLRGDGAWITPEVGGGGDALGILHYDDMLVKNATAAFTTNINGGSVSPGQNLRLRTGTAAYNYVMIDTRFTSVSASNFINITKMNLRWCATVLMEALAPEFKAFVGSGSVNVYSYQSNYDYLNSVGFQLSRLSNGSVKIATVTANGTGNTVNDLAAYDGYLSSTQSGVYLAIEKTQTEVRFYIDGELAATHTTHIPIGDNANTSLAPIVIAASNPASVFSQNIFIIMNASAKLYAGTS